MCEECRKRAARIPQGTITAIEAHKAELIEILVEINNAANPEHNEEALEGGHLTRETLGACFAPYVIGYILGQQSIDANSKVDCATLIMTGVQAGSDRLNSEGVH